MGLQIGGNKGEISLKDENKDSGYSEAIPSSAYYDENEEKTCSAYETESDTQDREEWFEQDYLKQSDPTAKLNNSREKYQNLHISRKEIKYSTYRKTNSKDKEERKFPSSYCKLDKPTMDVLQKLINVRPLRQYHEVIGKGKNSVVIAAGHTIFEHGIFTSEFENAIKIYKLTNDENLNRAIYKRIEREYQHMALLRGGWLIDCVPFPAYYHKNVLVMSIVGSKEEPAVPLSSILPENCEDIYETIVRNLKVFYKYYVVHGKLSAENILIWRNNPYYVGWSNSSLYYKNKPLAHEKLMRDCCFVTKSFDVFIERVAVCAPIGTPPEVPRDAVIASKPHPVLAVNCQKQKPANSLAAMLNHCCGGDEPKGLYILVSGLLEASYIPPDDDIDEAIPNYEFLTDLKFGEPSKDYIVSGNAVGVLGVLTNRPYSYTVRCDSAVQAYYITMPVIKEAFNLAPHPIQGLEAAMWREIGIKLSMMVLPTVPAYHNWSVEKISMRLEHAFVPCLKVFKIFVVNELMEDIVLLDGICQDAATREVFQPPCYIPRTAHRLIFPTSSQLVVSSACPETKLLLVPAKDSDELDIMEDELDDMQCELVSNASSRCLYHKSVKKLSNDSRMKLAARRKRRRGGVRRVNIRESVWSRGTHTPSSHNESSLKEATSRYFRPGTDSVAERRSTSRVRMFEPTIQESSLRFREESDQEQEMRSTGFND